MADHPPGFTTGRGRCFDMIGNNNRTPGVLIETAQDALNVQDLQEEIRRLKCKLAKTEEAVKLNNADLRGMHDLCTEFLEKFQQVKFHDTIPQSPEEPDKMSNPISGAWNSEHFKLETESHQDQLKKLQAKVKEQEDISRDLTEEYIKKTEERTSEIERAQRELSSAISEKQGLYERVKQLEAVINDEPPQRSQSELLKEVANYKCIVAKQQKELAVSSSKQSDLMQKLSEEWSQKVSSSESDLENISIKNRPMNISSEYEQLFSNEWLDVKSDLDSQSGLSEEDKITALCKILLKAEEVANSKYKEVMISVTQNLTLPLCTIFPSPFLMAKSEWTQTEEQQSLASKVGLTVHSQAQAQPPNGNMAMEIDDPQENGMVGPPCGKNVSVLGADSLLDLNSKPEVFIRNEHMEHTSPSMLPDTDEEITSPSTEEQQHHQYPKQSRYILILKGQTDLECINIPKSYKLTLHNTIGDILRLNSDTMNLASLEMELRQFMQNGLSGVGQNIISKNVFMTRYVVACCRLCWKMVIQRPKMAFVCNGIQEKWDSHTQDVFFGAVNPEHRDAVVSYYVKPGLVHGDKFMVKGQIMTKLCSSVTDPAQETFM